jgi:hypothetical protein
MDFVKMTDNILKGLRIDINFKGEIISKMKLPNNIFFCNSETFDYFIAGRQEQVQVINNTILRKQLKSNNLNISELIRYSKLTQRKTTLGCMISLNRERYIKARLDKQKIKYIPDKPTIFISCEKIKDISTQIHDRFLPTSPKNDITSRIIEFVILHEIGHVTFDTSQEMNTMGFSDKAVESFDEAYANYFAYNYADELGKIVINIISCLDENISHSYYHLLNNLDQNIEILKFALNGNIKEALNSFFTHIHCQPWEESNNESIIWKENFPQSFPGFFSRNIRLITNGYVKGVSNIKSGLVIVPHINILEGYFPESTVIISNRIDFHDHYKELPNHIKVVSSDKLNIKQIVNENNDIDDIILKIKDYNEIPDLSTFIKR